MKQNLYEHDSSFYNELKRQQDIREDGPSKRREKRSYCIAIAGLIIAALSLIWQILDKLI
jgi:hypothetical protein